MVSRCFAASAEHPQAIGGVSIEIGMEWCGEISMVNSPEPSAEGLGEALRPAMTMRKPLSPLEGELSTPFFVTEEKKRSLPAGSTTICPPWAVMAPACPAARQIDEP